MTILFWIIEYMATVSETFTFCLFTELFIGIKEKMSEKVIYSIVASALIIIINKIKIFSFVNGCMGIIIIIFLQIILFRKKYSIIALCTLIYAALISVIDFGVAQMGECFGMWKLTIYYKSKV